jgi:S1-C subfamily serine protease
MYVIATTYFGNSGGGIYNYDGKLVGIMSHIANLKPKEDLPDYVIAGAVRLETILKFMEGVN